MNFIEVIDDTQIAFVEKLAHDIWHEYYTPLIGKDQVEYMLAQFQSAMAINQQIREGHSYYLLRDPNRVYMGYIGLRILDDELFLNRIYILAEHRGQGRGREAIKFVEQQARKYRCTRVTLTVNKNNADAIKAYERLGFVNAGPVVQDIGGGFKMDDYKMEKVF